MKKVLIYANMDWFDPCEQPPSLDVLPVEFSEAKVLWEADSANHQARIIDLLSRYVGARLVLCNIADWEELFVDEGGQCGEIEAREVKVVGIDFSRGPIPVCKAEAYFEVQVVDGFSEVDLDEWQSDHDQFWSSVVFFWNMEGEGLEDLDLSSGDNQGVEFMPVGE